MKPKIEITGNITGLKYTPHLTRDLKIYNIDDLQTALNSDASFILEQDDGKKIALSWWVSSKRTRSYPYGRVYDTMNFDGKKVTIIPAVKDEGQRGCRDFLQWDTISLMSLLGVYTIISYYKTAKVNPRYANKITNQEYDMEHVKAKLKELSSYQSDALHWNLEQSGNISHVGNLAIESYQKISQELGVRMHSSEQAISKFKKFSTARDKFKMISRDLAKQAQERESVTLQPKEKISGVKGSLTIKNYLGGQYFFTSDEVEIENNKIFLIEAKHTSRDIIPQLSDIKDGILRMILFSNLQEVKIGNKQFIPKARLKLTSNNFNSSMLTNSQKTMLENLKKEAIVNKFQIMINDNLVVK